MNIHMILLLLKISTFTYGSVLYGAPIVTNIVKLEDVSIPDARYSFSYDINSPVTGDVKSHAESRQDGKVTGKYTVLQPDGIQRIVKYEADEKNGFTAMVENNGVATQTKGEGISVEKVEEPPVEIEKVEVKSEPPTIASRLVKIPTLITSLTPYYQPSAFIPRGAFYQIPYAGYPTYSGLWRR